MNLAMDIGLVKKTVSVARGGLFWASSPTEFSANGGMSIGICRCACARRNFTMDQLKTADT